MDVEWGPESAWGSGPRLDEFLLARIAEDERLATADDAPTAAALPDGHASPFDPARVHAECAAKRRIVLSCRELRPDTRILGARPTGMADFPLAPHDQHQLAALDLEGRVRWTGLDVLATSGGSLLAAEGTVEFRASYVVDGRSDAQHEHSRFVRVDGRWLYLDGLP